MRNSIAPRTLTRSIKFGFTIAIISYTTCATMPIAVGQTSNLVSEKSQKTVDGVNPFQLVKQLSADEFAEREDARQKLMGLGSGAFDALYAAQSSDVVEVRYAAKSMLSKIKIEWAEFSDTAELKEIMLDYSSSNQITRLAKIMAIARLPNREKLLGLSRIVKFDLSEKVSKNAALEIFKTKIEPDQETQFGKEIFANLKNSNRLSATWLCHFANILQGDQKAWSRLDQAMLTELETNIIEPKRIGNDRTTARNVLFWYADFQLSSTNGKPSMDLMRKSMNLLDGSRQELIMAADWFVEKKTWPMLLKLYERFEVEINRDPLALYFVADALQNTGQIAASEELVARARKINETDGQFHMRLALNLQERGYFKWSEMEYQATLDVSEFATLEHLQTRTLLSEMLHDLGRDKEAADVISDLMNVVDNDAEIRKTIVESLYRDPNSIASRMHYFYSIHYQSKNKMDLAIKSLEQSLERDPLEADSLIAGYRMTNAPAEFQESIKKKINAAVGKFVEDISEWEKKLLESDTEAIRQDSQWQLALSNNQYAWLVSNTFGDFKKAIRCSHRSLELRPMTSSYFDTLGRCYYADKDFENAVKYQQMAVELEPYSPLLKKQLQLFQSALSDSKLKQDQIQADKKKP